MPEVIRCPQCQKEIQWNKDFPYRPFCCKRCQLIDLGEWANEEHVIPATENADEYELAIYPESNPSLSKTD